MRVFSLYILFFVHFLPISNAKSRAAYCYLKLNDYLCRRKQKENDAI